MKILGIETATATTSVALCEGSQVLGQVSVNVAVPHSETLLPMVEKLMEFVGLPLESVDIFAVSGGPGSFTGLRVGLSAAKGFAVAGGRLVAVVPTLEALAYNACLGECGGGFICSAIDARCGNVYAGIFKCPQKGEILRWQEDRSVAVNTLRQELQKLAKEAGPVMLAGEAAALLACEEGAGLLVADESLNYPTATSVCRLASQERFWQKPGEACPEYLKPPQIQQPKQNF